MGCADTFHGPPILLENTITNVDGGTEIVTALRELSLCTAPPLTAMTTAAAGLASFGLTLS